MVPFEIPAKPVLLLLEDDVNLSDEIRKICESCEWQVLTSRSVEGALAVARLESKRIALALVDSMIPLTEADCEQLDEGLHQRRQIAMAIINPRDPMEPDGDTLARIRDDLDVIDFRIQQLVSIEGGLEFLRQAESESLLDGWRIALCTARSNIDNNVSLPESLRNGGGRWLGLFAKPITTERIAEILSKARLPN